MVGHPVIAGIISGGVILAPLAFLAERLIARFEDRRDEERAAAELERWRGPAREAAYTYMRAARRTSLQVLDHVVDVIEKLSLPKPREGLGPVFEQISSRDPGWFADFSEYLDGLSIESGQAASSAVSILALYSPFAEHADDVARSSRLLRHAARESYDVFLALAEQGPDATTSEEDRSRARRLAELLDERDRLLEQLRHDLSEHDPELELPPMQPVSRTNG
jgi:hypothetical protein